MDDSNCCGKINSNPLKEGWLQLLLEKANNLNKKMDPTIPRIEHSNLEGEKCFVEEKQLLLGSTQFFI